MNRPIEYTIISKPIEVSFECPFCKNECRTDFENVYYNTDYWCDGAVVDCPECGKEIELGVYDYD